MTSPSAAVLGDVLEAYGADPVGWHVTIAPDHRSRTVVIFRKGRRVWQVKTHHITPYHSVGVGGTARADSEPSEDVPSFGWRSLSPSLAARIKADIAASGALSPETVSRIGREEPRRPEEMPRGVLEGPVTILSNPVSAISKSQATLDSNLTRALDKLLLKTEGASMHG